MQPLQKFETRIPLDAKCLLFLLHEFVPCESCSLLRTLDSVRGAVLNEANPIPGLTNRLSARCKKFHDVVEVLYGS